MSQQLNQLKKILLDGEFDSAENRKYVAELEEQLADAAATEKIAEIPIITEFIGYLTLQKDQANLSLSTNEELTDRQRIALFEKKKLCDYYISLFTGQRQSVEKSISDALDYAQQN